MGKTRLPEQTLDAVELEHLLTRVQDGVVSRRQVMELNGNDADIARMLRRRELSIVHPGVYVSHTGPLTWDQRAWAAVLVHWPAALCDRSALPQPPKQGAIHVAIDMRRSVARVPGVIAHRTADLDARVQWHKSPPRIAIEHAAIDVAVAAPDRLATFRVLADACQTRRTSAERIAVALRARRRVPGRAFLLELLDDLALGACSVLEREYLELERRHGLPVEPDTRQATASINGHKAYRDVDHADYGVAVELDSRAHHDNTVAWDADHERDLDTVVTSDKLTVRLTYGQVLKNGCRTIRKVALLLERRGWPGPFLRCPDCPPDT